jgi:plasmid stability protein
MEPWFRFGVKMAVNLSIKGVPDAVARRLRERAQRHHRSLQGELMAIVEAAAAGEALAVAAPASPAYREPARPTGAARADDLLDRLDADLRGAGLAGGPWLAREALHDRAVQREAAAQSAPQRGKPASTKRQATRGR